MAQDKQLQKLLDERRQLAASRGFTVDYQQEQETQDNAICHKALAPATHEKYDRAVRNWVL